MIIFVKRQDLDVEKYNICIKNSLQDRMYAFSWYLDIVADNWGVLVLNNYEAVMPIPWRKKYFIKYVYQPSFAQQLGVFSLKEISEELILNFLKKIPKRFLKIWLQLNSDNFLNQKFIKQRDNYILSLNKEYYELFKDFNKGRKHATKVGDKNNLYVKEISILKLIEIKKQFYNYGSFSESVIKQITKEVLKRNKGFVLGVYKDEILLGGALFLVLKNRITYLFSGFNDQGKKHQASSFLIKEIIKKYEDSQFILDFEGGNLPNIGSFFKSFGAKTETYYELQCNNLPIFLKNFKNSKK